LQLLLSDLLSNLDAEPTENEEMEYWDDSMVASVNSLSGVVLVVAKVSYELAYKIRYCIPLNY
jgi:hypothetical protein